MKAKNVITKFALCLTILMTSSNVIAQVPCYGVPIDITYRPATSHNTPRMPAFNPFYAYLEEAFVSLGSTSSYGTVIVCITSTSGDYVTVSFDTDEGSIVVPISGDAGHYILTITTENNLVYGGEFDCYRPAGL